MGAACSHFAQGNEPCQARERKKAGIYLGKLLNTSIPAPITAPMSDMLVFLRAA